MSGKQLHRFMLICDGCGKTVGENGEYTGSGTVRRVALALGWKMVPKTRSDGSPGKPARGPDGAWSGHDVCPECLPDFEPAVHPTAQAAAGRPSWWKTRVDELQRRVDELEGRQATAPPPWK